MSTPELPDKLYFKIGEVAKLVGVKPYVLRYWESEFSVVRPEKTRSRHRLYRRKDVETLLEIRRLLHDERYTIAGAKRRLRKRTAAPVPRREVDDATVVLSDIRRQLVELCERLGAQPSTPAPLVVGSGAE